MYQLIIRHKNLEISNRKLSLLECRSIEGDSALWIINAFDKYIGLDINNYTISEYERSDGKFIINIRTEDLAKLRNNKLNSILKDEDI